MGCGPSSLSEKEDAESKGGRKSVGEPGNQNEEIEKQLRDDRIAEKRVVKLLLLGSSDSGKSTIAKQMRILHLNGFDETELINFRYLVYNNIIMCIQQLVYAVKDLNIDTDAKDKELINSFNQLSEHVVDQEVETLQICKKCYQQSEAIRAAYAKRELLQLPDNADHFLNDLSRLTAADYVPTELDILHCRVVTTGVHEIVFEYRNKVMRLIDVGGQRTERRKWIHCFEGVTAILFITALSCYDQALAEDLRVNRMLDSLELFKEIISNQYLLKSAVILFLNKKDLFANKIIKIPLSKYFDKYTGGSNYDEASAFVKEMYVKSAAVINEERGVYPHFTNATDTKNVDLVFGAACEIILQKNLNKAGMT